MGLYRSILEFANYFINVSYIKALNIIVIPIPTSSQKTFLKAFLKKGSFTMISSHFSGVKAFALSEEKLLVGSMLFDEEKLD